MHGPLILLKYLKKWSSR